MPLPFKQTIKLLQNSETWAIKVQQMMNGCSLWLILILFEMWWHFIDPACFILMRHAHFAGQQSCVNITGVHCDHLWETFPLLQQSNLYMVQLGLPLSVRNSSSQNKIIASIQIKVHIAVCRDCRIIEWSSQRCLFGSVCADSLQGDQPNLQNKWWFCIFLQSRHYGWYVKFGM